MEDIDYNDWFGIPSNEIKFDNQIKDNKKEKESLQNQNKDSLKNEHNKKHHTKSLINKKRKPPNSIDANIEKIKIENKGYIICYK